MSLRLGTRGSALARAQTEDVRGLLRARGIPSEVVIIETAGDRDRASAFADIGAPGVFVREIESALLDGRIDVAVHSFKDLPSSMTAGLTIAAIPERVDAADRLLIRPAGLDDCGVGFPLAGGARVGTSSARRAALLADARPDLEIAPLRGNVPTRLGRLAAGDYDAILLAAAGLDRLERAGALPPAGLGVRQEICELRLSPEDFVPAPSQGALALQTRAEDGETRELVGALDDPRAARPVAAERALLALVEGGCQVPFGAWCRTADDGALELHAALAKGGRLARARGRADDPDALARSLWSSLREALS